MPLHTRGSELLSSVQTVMENAGIRTVIMWGTLLGHVRDGGFIAHDTDIDINMFPQDVAKIPALDRVIGAFGLKNEFISPYLFRLFFADEPELHVDIWIFYEEGPDYTLCMKRRAGGIYRYKLPKALFERQRRVMFEGVSVSAPEQAERILDLAYGPWRTRNEAFSDDDAPCATIAGTPPPEAYIAPEHACFATWSAEDYIWSSRVRLKIGDPAPAFTQRTSAAAAFSFGSLKGRYTVLCFFGTSSQADGHSALLEVIWHRDLFDGRRLGFFGISVDPRDEQRLRDGGPGLQFIWDFDQRVSFLYGAVDRIQLVGQRTGLRPFWLILDPSSNVLASFPLTQNKQDHALLFAFLKHLPGVAP